MTPLGRQHVHFKRFRPLHSPYYTLRSPPFRPSHRSQPNTPFTAMADADLDAAQLTEDQQLALQQFIAITDQAPKDAIPLLRRCQWNAQVRPYLYFTYLFFEKLTWPDCHNPLLRRRTRGRPPRRHRLQLEHFATTRHTPTRNPPKRLHKLPALLNLKSAAAPRRSRAPRCTATRKPSSHTSPARLCHPLRTLQPLILTPIKILPLRGVLVPLRAAVLGPSNSEQHQCSCVTEECRWQEATESEGHCGTVYQRVRRGIWESQSAVLRECVRAGFRSGKEELAVPLGDSGLARAR